MKLEKEFIKLQKKISKLEEKGQMQLARSYKNLLDELREEIGSIYRLYETDGVLTYNEMSKYGRLKNLDKKIIVSIMRIYNENNKTINNTLKAIASETYKETINILEVGTNKKLKGIVKELRYDIINEQMAGLKWTERLQQGRSNAIYDIQKEIKQGLTQGDTYGTMAKRLKKVLETDLYKANRIVRTESHRVFAETQRDSLSSISKHGVKMSKKWVTSRDEAVRGNHPKDKMDHVSMDKVVIPEEDDFILPDGSTGYGPGLTNSINDINCRCFLVRDIIMDNNIGLSANDYTGEPDEAIFIEKFDKVDYDIAKEKLIEYEKDIIGKDRENAYVITKDAEVYKFEGQQSTVNPTTLGNKLTGSYITHNHPENETEYTFSNADLEFFKENKIEYLRGIDNKYTYELSKSLFEMEELKDYQIEEIPDDYFYHYMFYLKAKEGGVSYRRTRND